MNQTSVWFMTSCLCCGNIYLLDYACVRKICGEPYLVTHYIHIEADRKPLKLGNKIEFCRLGKEEGSK